MLIHAKLYRSAGLLFSLVFIVMLTLNSCTEQTPNSFEPAKVHPNQLSKLASLTKEEAAKDIQLLAKGLAFVLRDEQNRRILETEKNSANTVEDKLDVVKFIRATRNITVGGQTKATSFEAMFASALSEQERNDLKTSLDKLPAGAFDAYFPIRKQRDAWSSAGTDLLVVAKEPCDCKEGQQQVTAFDLHGNTHSLSARVAPSIPALVIAMNEAKGAYPKKDQSSGQLFANLKKDGAGGTTFGPEDPPPPPPPPPNLIRLNKFLIGNDYDDCWLCGTMEIYFKVWHHGGWHVIPAPGWVFADIYQDRLYTISWVVAGFALAEPNQYIHLEIWESDDFDDDFIANQWYEMTDAIWYQNNWFNVNGGWRSNQNVIPYHPETAGIGVEVLSHSYNNEQDWVYLSFNNYGGGTFPPIH